MQRPAAFTRIAFYPAISPGMTSHSNLDMVDFCRSAKQRTLSFTKPDILLELHGQLLRRRSKLGFVQNQQLVKEF